MNIGRVALVTSLLASAGCYENTFLSDDYVPGPPAQASVVSTSGGAVIHWSAVDGATGYEVFVTTSSDELGAVGACAGDAETRTPCTIRGLSPGQIYYVRVATLYDGFDPATD